MQYRPEKNGEQGVKYTRKDESSDIQGDPQPDEPVTNAKKRPYTVQIDEYKSFGELSGSKGEIQLKNSYLQGNVSAKRFGQV